MMSHDIQCIFAHDLQDLGFDYCFLGESFETSVPWDRWVPPPQGNLLQNMYDWNLCGPAVCL